MQVAEGTAACCAGGGTLMRNGLPRKTFCFAVVVFWRDSTRGRSDKEVEQSGSTDRNGLATELQPELRREALVAAALATRRSLASRRGRTKRLT